MWLGDWDEAVKQFDEIIEDPTHDLVALNSVFGQNATHKEALFVYQRDRLLPLGDNNAGGGGTWIGSMFTNRLYEMSGGQVLATVEGGGQALGWAYPNDYLKSLYDQVNDLRFTTYYYPLEIYNNNPNHPNFGQEISYDSDFRRYHWSLKKFYDNEKNILSNDSWKDLIYYRYAETLLLAAESHWRASGSDTDPKALEYINKIRRRAFGVNNDTYDFTTFTLDTYLEEHARELAFEKHRWFELKRMGILVERQNAHYMYGSNTGNQKLEPMAPHMKTLPIPQSAIDKMGDSFPQNEGYF